MKQPTDIAIWRKPNGPFLYTERGVMRESATPRFIPRLDRAKLCVRIDMGLSLSDVEFKTRSALTRTAEGGDER